MSNFRVSLLVTGAPQFETQDDFGLGTGIQAIPQWERGANSPGRQRSVDDLVLDPAVGNILERLRNIFQAPQESHLTNTELLDLTCFVAHRLLLLPPITSSNLQLSAISECFRYAMVLYMMILHGTTYYSHMDLANVLILRLKENLLLLASTNYPHDALETWIISVAMAAAVGNTEYKWFMDRACTVRLALDLQAWGDVLAQLESVLWMRTDHENAFRQAWEEVLLITAN